MQEVKKFCIVGFGNIGLKHGKHIIENISTKFVAVCDINLEAEEKLPSGVAYYTNFEKILKEVKANVICICTPNNIHATHTIAALQAGLHSTVEKPIAMRLNEFDLMIPVNNKTGKSKFAAETKLVLSSSTTQNVVDVLLMDI